MSYNFFKYHDAQSGPGSDACDVFGDMSKQLGLVAGQLRQLQKLKANEPSLAKALDLIENLTMVITEISTHKNISIPSAQPNVESQLSGPKL